MSFFTKEQFVSICDMQSILNNKTAGASWRSQGLAWDTATYVETTEAMNHLGWEWWKQATPDLPQAKLEIIDILHFTISGLLAGTPDDPEATEQLFYKIESAVANMDKDQLIELRTWNTITTLKEIGLNAVVDNYGFAVYLTVLAGATLDMTPSQMYDMYIGKNVLNQFRKANGYKEGTYIKIWFGKEDNEYLTEVMDSYYSEGVTPTPEQLTEHLNATYYSVKTNQQH